MIDMTVVNQKSLSAAEWEFEPKSLEESLTNGILSARPCFYQAHDRQSHYGLFQTEAFFCNFSLATVVGVWELATELPDMATLT